MTSFPPGKLIQAALEERYDRWLIKTAPTTQRAAEQDIFFQERCTFSLAVEWREFRNEDSTEADAVELDDWTFSLKVAKDYGGEAIMTVAGAVSAEDAEAITFEVDPDDTALTGWTRGVYDLTATHTSGKVIRLLQGRATLSRAATGS